MITLPPLLFLAGSPGPLELLVIFAVILVLFGPRKLPEIARSLGRMLSELRKASEDFKSQLMSLGERDVDACSDDAADKLENSSVDPYDVAADVIRPASTETTPEPHEKEVQNDDQH